MLSHYVIVRRDLPLGFQLAYSVHAAGESVSEAVPEGTRAVVLAARDLDTLEFYERLLAEEQVPHKTIREDGQAYAIGVAPTADRKVRHLLSCLPLAPATHR